MKRLIFILGFLLFAIPVYPATNDVQTVFVASSSGTVDNCPDKTYDFAWTGNNTSGSTVACLDNGASAKTIDINSGGIFAPGQITLDSTNDTACWDINETTLTGTIWFTSYGVVATTATGNMVSLDNGTVIVLVRMDSTATDTAGSYNGIELFDSPDFTAIEVDLRFGYSWDLSGTDKHILVEDSSDWADGEEDVEVLTQVPSNFSQICIGDSVVGASGVGGTYIIKDVYFINGTYEALDPDTQ